MPRGVPLTTPVTIQQYFDQRKYGMGLGEREKLELDQGGVCAICGRPPKKLRLSVDHCYKCAKFDLRKSVRGLLCVRCNRGFFRGDPVLLRQAADYFEKHILGDFHSKIADSHLGSTKL